MKEKDEKGKRRYEKTRIREPLRCRCEGKCNDSVNRRKIR